MLFDIFLVFLLIFSFPLPVVGNSLFLALILSLCRILYRGKVGTLQSVFCLKYIVRIFIGAFCLSCISLFYVIILQTNDYEKSYSFISQIIGLFITVFVFVSIYDFTKTKEYVLLCIVQAFVVQSIIQILAFMLPSFREIVVLFQFSEDAERAEYYGGIRGLAISGRLFFELAASYGLIAILYIKYLLDNDLGGIKYLIYFILLFVGSFFVGRTAIIGFMISFLYLILYQHRNLFNFKLLMRLLTVSVFASITVFICLAEEYRSVILDKLLPWVFEIFYKYVDTGHAQSNSLDSLNDMYSIEITNREWLVGVGKYVNFDGTYYKQTDSGFLRQILFWGLWGSVLNLIYMFSFLYVPFYRTLYYCSSKRNEILFFVLIVGYLFMLHYKGELMGHSRFFLDILLLYFLQIILSKKHVYGRN